MSFSSAPQTPGPKMPTFGIRRLGSRAIRHGARSRLPDPARIPDRSHLARLADAGIGEGDAVAGPSSRPPRRRFDLEAAVVIAVLVSLSLLVAAAAIAAMEVLK